MIAEMRTAWNELLDAVAGGESRLDFELPPALEAHTPPEARGLARDEVRLMISRVADDAIIHRRFRDLPEHLDPGDVVVINTSGTMQAALPAVRGGGMMLELHLSTRLPGDLWVVELRRPAEQGTAPFGAGEEGETLLLPDGGTATLLTPHAPDAAARRRRQSERPADEARKWGGDGIRLWIARLDLPHPLEEYLPAHGYPIRYHYVDGNWPIEYYQTVYATRTGSAEMPSAGRAFTPEIITRLVAKGIMVVPVLLHTGVASLEEHEFPYEEYYQVPPHTAAAINTARAAGARIVATGTTVVRALETVTGRDGVTHPGEGWTNVIITPERGIRSVNALITGMHEPQATHLAMLEALCGRGHLRATYAEALRERYLWHEFGDLHLIDGSTLPGGW